MSWYETDYGWAPRRPTREGMQPECWEADPVVIKATRVWQPHPVRGGSHLLAADITEERVHLPAVLVEPSVMDLAKRRAVANVYDLVRRYRSQRRTAG